MDHLYDYLFIFSFLLFAVMKFYLMIMNWRRIDSWGSDAKLKFIEFESFLQQPLQSYVCYTNDRGVWVAVKYEDTKRNILSRLIPSNNVEVKKIEFDLKSDEIAKRIYIGQDDDNFDWASVQHYEEWVESFKDISERIKRYKKKHFPELRF